MYTFKEEGIKLPLVPIYSLVAVASILAFTCDGAVAREREVADASLLIKKNYPNPKARIEKLRLKPSYSAIGRSFAEFLDIQKADQARIFVDEDEGKKSSDGKRLLNLPFIRSKLGNDKFEAELFRKFVSKFTTWEDPKKYPHFTKMLELMKKSEEKLSTITFKERDQIFEEGFKDFATILSTPNR